MYRGEDKSHFLTKNQSYSYLERRFSLDRTSNNKVSVDLIIMIGYRPDVDHILGITSRKKNKKCVIGVPKQL